MKFRIKDNSVRLRLTRGEVDVVRERGIVEAKTCFPGGRELKYRVESSPASVSPAAFFSDNAVTVRLPEAAVLAWATTEQVSMRGEQVLDDGAVLLGMSFLGGLDLTQRGGILSIRQRGGA